MRTGAKHGALIALCLAGAFVFSGLGLWQVQRLFWKLDLIARVNARVVAAPNAPPPARQWRPFDTKAHEYRHVRIFGKWVGGHDTLVGALTELGSGFWVMTPLRTDEGVVLVNRGFITIEQSAARRWNKPDQQEATITGLLRGSEPNGRFLRPNHPERNLWYSRDVAAIGRARGFANLAPFFIDADASANAPGGPVGGLTVVHFRNAHLVYAITWFGLAVLCASGLVIVLRRPQDGS